MKKSKELNVYFELIPVPVPPEKEVAYWNAIRLLSKLIEKRVEELKGNISNEVRESASSNPSSPLKTWR